MKEDRLYNPLQVVLEAHQTSGNTSNFYFFIPVSEYEILNPEAESGDYVVRRREPNDN